MNLYFTYGKIKIMLHTVNRWGSLTTSRSHIKPGLLPNKYFQAHG